MVQKPFPFFSQLPFLKGGVCVCMHRAVCAICAHDRRQVRPCGSCGFQTCRQCDRKCSESFRVQCASCTRPWEAEELAERIGRNFWRTEYRATQRSALRIQETPRLEKSIPEAAMVRQQRRTRKELKHATQKLNAGDRDMLQQVLQLRRRLHKPPDAVKSCPRPGCKGFLSEDMSCDACGCHICATCGQAEEAGHVCDRGILESLKLLSRDSRACPKCGILSFRAEGCAVMWCTVCHSFWNWSTLSVVPTRATHVVPHNPDHRSWMTSRDPHVPRHVEDVPCGGLPTVHDMRRGMILEAVRSFRIKDCEALASLSRTVYRAHILRRRYPLTWDPVEVDADLRILFLVGDLSETRFASRLELAHRRRAFRKSVGLVLEAYTLSGADVLQRFCLGVDSAFMCMSNLWSLAGIANQALLPLRMLYGFKTPRLLTETMQWIID